MDPAFDLLIIGGGINGTAIARDAAGRGHQVALCEAGDLAEATSSASSKLAHGGLRYLEHLQFRLVREALEERETLLRTAPHIVRPLRFVLPVMPGGRPRWMLRAGLALYDRLGRRRALPASARIDLAAPPWPDVLAPGLREGFVYSDCQVDDARLVVLNAVDARDRGAEIMTRTRCAGLVRDADGWRATLEMPGGHRREVAARAVVNAAGPWAEAVRTRIAGLPGGARLRLVKGSHIVVPALYDDPAAFILQNEDGRVVFVIPYAGRFSLIGTTDVPVADVEEGRRPSEDEIAYLCRAVGRYFRRPPARADVRWAFAGVRALHDDGRADPAAVSRDYKLVLDESPGAAALLSVFGGKITTARRLAEHALARLGPHLPRRRGPWTAHAALPGGGAGPFELVFAELVRRRPFLDRAFLEGIARRHGTLALDILEGAGEHRDLGPAFGGGLYRVEVDWLVRNEWAETADDILWRRTKCGLAATAEETARLEAYLGRVPVPA